MAFEGLVGSDATEWVWIRYATSLDLREAADGSYESRQNDTFERRRTVKLPTSFTSQVGQVGKPSARLAQTTQTTTSNQLCISDEVTWDDGAGTDWAMEYQVWQDFREYEPQDVPIQD